MIKRTAVLSVLVALLVGLLMYCISPGEVRTAWAVTRDGVSTQAGEVLAAMLHRRTNRVAPVRAEPVPLRTAQNIAPDPFRPFGPRRTSAGGLVSIWLKGPRAVALWLFMAALVWACRYVRTKRFQFAMEEKMAATLSKALRQL